MPAPIHAIVVARAEARTDAVAHLTETLDALGAQTRAVAAMTIVLCGTDPRLAAIAADSGAEGVISASANESFAAAVALAARRVDGEHAVWLLGQDTAPFPDAARHLSAKLETSPSVAFVAPKLIQADSINGADDDEVLLESAGMTMTELGRTVVFGTDQIDQGQQDDAEDILGSDIRGVLIRAKDLTELLPDPALAGADEGLDLGVRARLRGNRVSLVPHARVAVHGDGVAGLPAPRRERDRRRIMFSSRVAQLHRRLVYAPIWAVPLHLLSFPIIALWRAIGHLIDKQPARVLPEWGATAMAGARWGAISRSRRGLGPDRDWSRIAPLRLSRRQLRSIEEQGTVEDTVSHKSDLRYFSGGGAWVTLAALAVSIVIFIALLGWPSIAGGAMLPLHKQLTQLWGDSRYGYIGQGLGEVGPADPFSTFVALLGSTSPANPGGAFVMLWLLALPLAVLGGWFAATRITERSGLRILAGIAWAVAPTFLSALMNPRPTAVIAHLLLPWFCYAVTIAHRSWGAAGAASLFLVGIAACSPSLGVVLVAFCLAALVVFVGFGRIRAGLRYFWVVVPTAVWFLPIVWRNFANGTPLAILADPGAVYAGARASDDVWGRLLTAAGFADKDPGGWASMLAAIDMQAAAPAAALLVIPLVLVALCAPFIKRWRLGFALVLVAAVAVVAGLTVSRIALSIRDGQAVAIWPGSLISAAWLAIVLASLLVLDSARVPKLARSLVAGLAGLLLVVSAVPQLTAPLRHTAELRQGTVSTLPAFVAATAETDEVATLVLTAQDDGSFNAKVVWGGTESLTAQSTLQATRTTVTAADELLASEIASMVTPGAGVSATDIGALGVEFVVVSDTAATAQAQAAREAAVSSLDLRAGLTAVGETGKGALWRLDAAPADRAELTDHQESLRRNILLAGLGVLVIAFLLAIPTPSSVRASRRRPRIVDANGADQI